MHQIGQCRPGHARLVGGVQTNAGHRDAQKRPVQLLTRDHQRDAGADRVGDQHDASGTGAMHSPAVADGAGEEVGVVAQCAPAMGQEGALAIAGPIRRPGWHAQCSRASEQRVSRHIEVAGAKRAAVQGHQQGIRLAARSQARHLPAGKPGEQRTHVGG